MADVQAATVVTANVTPLEMVLATKLYIPQPRPNLVARPHLVSRLNAALKTKPGVILLSASPGFGKTTLLSEWIHHLTQIEENPDSSSISTPQVAWLSLDADDNAPNRFLTYCIAALQTIHPKIGQITLDILRNPSTTLISPDLLVTSLINEMMVIPEPFIFVFEDFHVINNPILHNSLAFLLDNLPPQVHLVITSRTDLHLPLARLRGRGQLTELGTADLRFTADEVATFLNTAMGCQLSAQDIATLEARTEGWIAGLHMAALSMKGLRDTSAFIKSFAGSHRHILDYLLEEVLNQQTEDVQQFLTQSSILNRMSGPLCDAIFADGAVDEAPDAAADNRTVPFRGNSQGMLQALEQANLFIVPLDDERCWYRYHHLFGELLRHRLEQTVSPEALTRLHHRASEWYEQNGYATEAMSHALAAVDVERIVRLAKQKAATLLSRSELITLLSWLDTLPKALSQGQPRLALVQAWAMLLTGQLQSVEPYLQQAEREFRTTQAKESIDVLGEITTLRAAVAYFLRDMEKAIELYRQALGNISPDNLFLRGILMHCLGASYSWCGNVVEAVKAYTEAGSISQSSGNMDVSLIATWNVGRLHAEQGYLHQAADIYRSALQLIDQKSSGDEEWLQPYTSRLYIGLAEIMYKRNELRAAQEHAQRGIKTAEESQESGTLSSGYLALAHIKLAQGDLSAALEVGQRAVQYANRYTGPRYLAAQASIFLAQLWLINGNLRAARQWIDDQNLALDPLPAEIPYLREAEYLTFVRFCLAQRQQIENTDDQPQIPLSLALDILSRISNAAQASNRTERVIEALALQALVYNAQGSQNQALITLQEAVDLAETEGYLRVFVDEGPPMGNFIKQIKPPDISADYRTKLLAAFTESSRLSNSQSPLLLDSLSDRELEILQLIATGMSNRELAETLVVTVGTVKWHLNNIYSKLSVKSRTQAVAQARALGLL